MASQVNTTLTLRNWYIGRMIDVKVLKKQRAGYDQEIVAALSRQFAKKYGRSFSRASLYHMLQFAQLFADAQIVATLSQQLSRSHFHMLLPVQTAEARAYYIGLDPSVVDTLKPASHWRSEVPFHHATQDRHRAVQA